MSLENHENSFMIYILGTVTYVYMYKDTALTISRKKPTFRFQVGEILRSFDQRVPLLVPDRIQRRLHPLCSPEHTAGKKI